MEKELKHKIMPQGEGTYGKQVGRPPEEESPIQMHRPDHKESTPSDEDKASDMGGLTGGPGGIVANWEDSQSKKKKKSSNKFALKSGNTTAFKMMGSSDASGGASPNKLFGGVLGNLKNIFGKKNAADAAKENAVVPDPNAESGTGVATPQSNAARLDALEAGGGATDASVAPEQWSAMGRKELMGMEKGARKEYMQGLTPEQRKMQGKELISNMGIGNAFGNMSMVSDIRLKEKIQRTGASPSGIPIYEFNYIGGETRYSGAMAQDLLETNPDAVSVDTSGFYKVNYNNIDVDMHLIN